ncbi:MAG TPA: WecB/TagA/CpsF family glycosyltransferase [Clostridia bacterium]|nr:WecB/TagA/CpsF family glycosyltransferase [Clostridia bacterium]
MPSQISKSVHESEIVSMPPPLINSAKSLRPPIAMLGVPFDNVTKAEAIELIELMVASRNPHYLVTANVDFLVQARADVELRRILFDAHLVLCDGTPLVWASRWLGNPLPERVAGADLVPLLINVAAQKGYRLFFLGATPESARLAVAKLSASYPQLVIAGHYSPPFAHLLDMDHDEIKKRIVEARPDILFVSFGCPKQEKWIAMHYRQMKVPVTIGVGATIDFLAGAVRRAPVWMQRTGTEWVFRLAQEPRRLFRRYARDLCIFGSSFLPQWWQLQFSRSRRKSVVSSQKTEPSQLVKPVPVCPPASSETLVNSLVNGQVDFQKIQLPERCDFAYTLGPSNVVELAIADGRHCLVDTSLVKFIDSTGVGSLIRLQKRLRALGREMILLAPSSPVRRALGLMRLDDFLLSVPDLNTAIQLLHTRFGEQGNTLKLPTLAPNAPLSWHGEVTAANAEEIWEHTRRYLTALPASQEGIINMAAVKFIDSSGLGLMVRARKLAQQEQKTLRFTELRPAVKNVIRIARLEEFLLKPQRMLTVER